MPIIRIKDTDGPEWDVFIKFPESITTPAAKQAVDRAILKVKNENPEDFTYDDVLTELAMFKATFFVEDDVADETF